MHYIIAYDICCPRRLRRVARVCEDYGLRIQKSVFECELSKPFLEDMMHRLGEIVDPKVDSITGLPICAACNAGRVEIGIPLQQEIPDVLVA